MRDGGGTDLFVGLDHGTLAADGRLSRIEGFWGEVPPMTTPPAALANLIAAMNEPDATTRAALLDAAVTDDVTVVTPNAAGSGKAVLDLWIQTDLGGPTARQYAHTAGPQITAMTLARTPIAAQTTGGTITGLGELFTAATAADGLITTVVLFDGPLP